MATKNYTTRTASLRATIADVRVIDVKKINLDGKNILDYIKESVPVITHSQDTRETVYTDDLWGQWVETKDDGTVVIHDDWVTKSSNSWISNVTKVENNKAYDGDFVLANIQTERIKDGTEMFHQTPLESFSGDLSSLVNGESMFMDTSLTSFSGDSSGSPVNLSSLVNGSWMFYGTSLTSFNGDLSSLVNGENMFYGTSLTSFSGDSSGSPVNLSSLVNGESMFMDTSLTSFSGDSSGSPVNLSSLVNGSWMFYGTSLTSFNGDLSSLVNGENMFYGTSLTSFSGDLSSLVTGLYMFSSTSLTPQSVMYIVESIRNITEEKAKYTSGEIPWVIKDSTTQKYSAPFGFMEDGKYVYTYNNPNPYTATIGSSYVGKLVLGINVTNDSETIEQQLQTFAEGCLCDSWEELKQEFVDKGWTVTFQYGGTITNIVLSEDEQFRGVPVYARLIEVSDEDKDRAEYCTEDGTKFYDIDWGHDVTDYDAYQYFGSLLEACGYYGVIPKKYLEEQA